MTIIVALFALALVLALVLLFLMHRWQRENFETARIVGKAAGEAQALRALAAERERARELGYGVSPVVPSLPLDPTEAPTR
jgi:uncharacterized membrane protein AbrB (regulator of aidB expression)